MLRVLERRNITSKKKEMICVKATFDDVQLVPDLPRWRQLVKVSIIQEAFLAESYSVKQSFIH